MPGDACAPSEPLPQPLPAAGRGARTAAGAAKGGRRGGVAGRSATRASAGGKWRHRQAREPARARGASGAGLAAA